MLVSVNGPTIDSTEVSGASQSTTWQPSTYEAARPAVLVQRRLHQGLCTGPFNLNFNEKDKRAHVNL